MGAFLPVICWEEGTSECC